MECLEHLQTVNTCTRIQNSKTDTLIHKNLYTILKNLLNCMFELLNTDITASKNQIIVCIMPKFYIYVSKVSPSQFISKIMCIGHSLRSKVDHVG